MNATKASVGWLAVVALVGVVGLGGVAVAASVEAGQSNVSPAPEVPSGAMDLGSVRIPRTVLANGETLAAGTYQVRVTGQQPEANAPGATESYERWAEFVQGGEVRGREVLSIVPASEIAGVAEASPPSAGGNKVEMLKGDDYLRVWINRDSTHYLIHLPVA